MTFYIQTHPGKGNAGALRSSYWHPWINSTDRKEVEALAAHRHLRDRGGVLEKEQPYEFTVYSYSDRDPKHANGKPMSVNATTFSARKEHDTRRI